MPAWGCCEPFYNPFYCHEKYDGKLYEVDRGRRRSLHYRSRIYFTCADVVDADFYPRQPPSARGGSDLDVARDFAGENRSRVLHSFVFSVGAKTQHL